MFEFFFTVSAIVFPRQNGRKINFLDVSMTIIFWQIHFAPLKFPAKNQIYFSIDLLTYLSKSQNLENVEDSFYDVFSPQIISKLAHCKIKKAIFRYALHFLRPSKKQHMFLVRISIKKRVGGRFFLLFVISYCMLSLHIITFPQGYVGALRSNINTTKHQILIKHKFV